MPSTPFAYSQVVSRTFASFRVVKSRVSAGQRDFSSGFDSRQLHEQKVRSTFLARPFSRASRSAVSAAAMASRLAVPAKTAPEYTQVLYRLNGKQASTAFDVPAHAVEFRRMVEQLGAVKGA